MPIIIIIYFKVQFQNVGEKHDKGKTDGTSLGELQRPAKKAILLAICEAFKDGVKLSNVP